MIGLGSLSLDSLRLDTISPDVIGPLYRLGFRGGHLRVLSLSSVGLCLGLWIRAKTVDQEERGNAERRAIFVGLWPPTLYLIGESLDDRGRQQQRRLKLSWLTG